MSDWYQQLTKTPVGKRMVSALNIPTPAPLRRYEPGRPILEGPVLLGAATNGRLGDSVRATLEELDVPVCDGPSEDDRPSEGGHFAALIFDATGIANASDLRALYDFFHPAIRQMGACARALVIGDAGERGDHHRRAAQRALDGFVRSAGKEMRKGSTANLIRVDEGAEASIGSTLAFFLSGRSAFVSGQTVHIRGRDAPLPRPLDPERPLDNQVALVTGAAQGIGAAIAEVLARDGAHVICLDIPAQGQALSHVANAVGGSSFQLDITAPGAPECLSRHLTLRHGGCDIVVHNAGITRDKTLAGMDPVRWDAVIDVNLGAPLRLTDALLAEGAIHDDGRIVCVSSLSGIAGNRGQTNYAASKAGVIGMVDALAPEMARRGGTINAVAPGFIETAMTAEMPFPVREAGRRMNSLNQGGLPVDVAETIAWLASPAAMSVNGNIVRVCGQSLLGA